MIPTAEDAMRARAVLRIVKYDGRLRWSLGFITCAHKYQWHMAESELKRVNRITARMIDNQKSRKRIP